jgi:hypothetical protein
VDIVFWIIWWVVLDNPVNFRKVQASLRNICAEQYSFLRLAELEVSRCALLLLLLAVNVFDGYVYIIQEITVELDRVAG